MIQDYIVERAQVEEVPVVENSEREKAIGAVHGARARSRRAGRRVGPTMIVP